MKTKEHLKQLRDKMIDKQFRRYSTVKSGIKKMKQQHSRLLCTVQPDFKQPDHLFQSNCTVVLSFSTKARLVMTQLVSVKDKGVNKCGSLAHTNTIN